MTPSLFASLVGEEGTGMQRGSKEGSDSPGSENSWESPQLLCQVGGVYTHLLKKGLQGLPLPCIDQRLEVRFGTHHLGHVS